MSLHRDDDPGNHGRTDLETRWLHLTRARLLGLAASRGWPIRNDHCFQHVLLDAACGARWLDHVAGRPVGSRLSPG